MIGDTLNTVSKTGLYQKEPLGLELIFGEL
jgi:hypothetical protein